MLKLIINTVKEYADINENSITPETNFLLDLHLTSYDIVCIIGDLENALGIEIPDREIKNLDTVDALVKYLESSIID